MPHKVGNDRPAEKLATSVLDSFHVFPVPLRSFCYEVTQMSARYSESAEGHLFLCLDDLPGTCEHYGTGVACNGEVQEDKKYSHKDLIVEYVHSDTISYSNTPIVLGRTLSSALRSPCYQKTRLIASSRGSGLSTVRSMKETLMAVYDGLEDGASSYSVESTHSDTGHFSSAHRALILQKGYLLQGLSPHNFFVCSHYACENMPRSDFAINSSTPIRNVLDRSRCVCTRLYVI